MGEIRNKNGERRRSRECHAGILGCHRLALARRGGSAAEHLGGAADDFVDSGGSAPVRHGSRHPLRSADGPVRDRGLPGSLFIARLGAVPTLVIGFLIAGVASALRGAILDAFALYAATIVMSAGIPFTQPALPPLVRQWLPHHVSLGTAIYTNGLLMG